ncbi:hypothetical protein [Sporisorium scitamineum]|uniref:Uncharacterized protein n=1 Tax=Sporisorium scitamineum TaxID=49012 RepID=A0A0F7S872_9BASI|nr:hypothetical protein [Sporisorium scitamineum]
MNTTRDRTQQDSVSGQSSHRPLSLNLDRLQRHELCYMSMPIDVGTFRDASPSPTDWHPNFKSGA